MLNIRALSFLFGDYIQIGLIIMFLRLQSNWMQRARERGKKTATSSEERKKKTQTDANNGNNNQINESVKNNFILFSDILIIR